MNSKYRHWKQGLRLERGFVKIWKTRRMHLIIKDAGT